MPKGGTGQKAEWMKGGMDRRRKKLEGRKPSVNLEYSSVPPGCAFGFILGLSGVILGYSDVFQGYLRPSNIFKSNRLQEIISTPIKEVWFYRGFYNLFKTNWTSKCCLGGLFRIILDLLKVVHGLSGIISGLSGVILGLSAFRPLCFSPFYLLSIPPYGFLDKVFLGWGGKAEGQEEEKVKMDERRKAHKAELIIRRKRLEGRKQKALGYL